MSMECHKAMTDQITTVSKLRFGQRLDELSWSDMNAFVHAISVQMGL